MIARLPFRESVFAAMFAALIAQSAHADEATALDTGRIDEAIRNRSQTQAGGSAYGELGLGYDSNLTGVPADFGAAAPQSFNLGGIQATGNSLERKAGFAHGAIGGQYDRPLSSGWSVFAGGEARGRAYRHESDFNIAAGEVRLGGARNDGANQWRGTASFAPFWQKDVAPGDPQPTNDRRMAGINLDWRHSVDPKTQVGLGLQLNGVRFPKNTVQDFDQAYLSASWLQSFERSGVPLVYLTAFATADHARNSFENGVSGR